MRLSTAQDQPRFVNSVLLFDVFGDDLETLPSRICRQIVGVKDASAASQRGKPKWQARRIRTVYITPNIAAKVCG
jgi:hypothetical protein